MNQSETSPVSDLPEMCVAVLQPQDVLIGIRRGEHGYHQMYEGPLLARRPGTSPTG